MLSQLTIGTKLITGAALMLAMSFALGVAGLISIAQMRAQFETAVDKTVGKIILATKITQSGAEMLSDQRNTMIAAYAKEPSLIVANDLLFRQHEEVLQQSLRELRPLLVVEEGKRLTAEIVAKLSEWLPNYENMLKQSQLGQVDEANRFRKLTTAPYQQLSQAGERLTALQLELLAGNKASLASQNTVSVWVTSGLLGLCVLTGVGLFIVVRQINRRLRQELGEMSEGANQVASASAGVSASSQSLAEGASEQAASLEETSASTEQIGSMARRNTENSKAAAALVTDSQQKFTETNRYLEQMVVAMAEINSSSDKIAKIIKVIDEISFQTNILALNAAVEAARAGEAGLGFAVVADEVRNLAKRCTEAAKDTATLIEESLTKSQEGKVRVDQVADSIRKITQESLRVKTLVDEVNVGSGEQLTGIEQIGKAITHMEQVTQLSAANAEEGAAAGEELHAQSEAMKAVVNRLVAMVGRG